MSTRKGRRNNNPHGHPQHNNQIQLPNPQLTDYESDAYFSDMQHQQAQAAAAAAAAVTAAAAPSRSNDEINLSVIRRHNPSVTAIISLAPYVVVYIFSPTTKQWEKNGVEGSLFVCQQTQGRLGEERYTAFVLNRRGLNNFDLPLTDSDNVEITEEYVILKADEGRVGEQGENGIADPMNPQHDRAANGSNSPTDVRIYGLWIYSEPPPNSTAEARTINAQLIRECAAHAGNSLKLAQDRLEAMRQHDLQVAAAAAETQAPPLEEIQASAPMGRQISLKDLFGQQRAQDDEWSVRAHHMSPAEIQMQMQMHQQQQQQQQPGMVPPPQHYPQPGQYPQQHYPQQQPSHPPPQPQGDVLGDLFRRAGLAYQG
ncbi:Dcp1-like decapping [Penicillium waksmanii]|uniref:Dcp1-like decapping n=1 Tax=Penicillium waksmanii TaxID=69791 RepID=UPI00254861B5|nr:Dcp1-like decapping [Penicillium waksmanii]KAJ5983162.1 Dcp1-like decapping [Penicillium waksmanii]